MVHRWSTVERPGSQAMPALRQACGCLVSWMCAPHSCPIGPLPSQRHGPCVPCVYVQDGRRHAAAKLQADTHQFASQFLPDELKWAVLKHLYLQARRAYSARWMAWQAEVRKLRGAVRHAERCIVEADLGSKQELELQHKLQWMRADLEVYVTGP